MAGIGPIFTNNGELLKRARFRSSLTTPANELEIFCSLCVGRVYFKKSTCCLYFVDSPTIMVTDIIKTVFRGIDEQPRFRQLYMDEHNLIKAASSIFLSSRQQKLVLVALKMNGLHIDIA